VDAQMNGEQMQAGLPVWDFFVDTTLMIVPMLTGALEAQQQAEVAAVLILGSIPQLPDVGVDWPGFLGGTVTFPSVDSAIRSMMTKAGHSDYAPDYTLVNGLLGVTAKKNASAT
jgi:hypothetical protein